MKTNSLLIGLLLLAAILLVGCNATDPSLNPKL